MFIHRYSPKQVLTRGVKFPGVHFHRLLIGVQEDWQGFFRFARLALILFLIGVGIIGGLLLRTSSAPDNASELLDWEQSAEHKTLHRFAPDMTLYATTVSYLYQPPAHALFDSDYRLMPKEPVTLGDLVILLGEPSQVDCLETRTSAERSIQWLCVRFHSGQIEGCTFFPEGEKRLLPQIIIHSIYYFAANSVYGPDTGLPWQGFTYLSAYICDE